MLLSQSVEHASPTDDKAPLDRLAAFLAGQARGLGAQTEILPQTAAGNFMRVRWNAKTAAESATPGWYSTTNRPTGWSRVPSQRRGGLRRLLLAGDRRGVVPILGDLLPRTLRAGKLRARHFKIPTSARFGNWPRPAICPGSAPRPRASAAISRKPRKNIRAHPSDRRSESDRRFFLRKLSVPRLD